jgi:hypothetical protein
MNRSVFVPALAVALCAAITSAASAQAKPGAAQAAAPQSAATPPARAKWVAPIKGIAAIQVIQGTSKRVGNEIHTVIKVKNMSSAPIAGFRADEYWYDKGLKVVSGDTQRWMKPFQPGEIIELTMKSPSKPDLYRSSINFVHANGKIDVKAVKAFK